MKIDKLAALGLIAILVFSRCSQKESVNSQNHSQTSHQPSIVQSTKMNVLDSNRPSVTPGVNSSESIQVVITANKDSLLSQEFLYGADLQYSSIYDPQMNLYNQSMAIGHIPARFRIVGDELQLVADNKRLFPSDVNHPEQIVSRYKILSQTTDTLTLSGANSTWMLSELLAGTVGTTTGALTEPKAKPPRDSWIRSFDYVEKGNYFLQQTSLVLDDGTIAEFMESVFPRKTLTLSQNFEKFAMDPESSVGATSGPIARFRMLPGEKNFEGETAVSYAQHFDISQNPEGTPTSTIDFYVTPNIPDEDILPVQLAVEGWNRYFTQFKGIQRKIVQFKGRLPEGIHLGDPRFNVINWDNRHTAGAAYESQASDPATGRQSHCLIYLPAAWLQIGADYWTSGKYSDPSAESVSPVALEKRGGVFKSSRLSCFRDIKDSSEVLTSGRLNPDEIKSFAMQTLKNTLFHEVGHALGLAHNFKGSLTYDHSNPNSLFSSSIMDYNDYEIERQAFTSVDSSEGPLLEYDRQALSTLYNHGNDIQSNDPILPACNDAEADQEEGGVDPLCIRYDIGKDPTLSIVTATQRIKEKTLEGDISLTQALERIRPFTLDNGTLERIKTREDLETLVQKLANSIQGSLKFYILSGKTSLSKTVTTNVKALLQFAEDILPDGPEGYSEREMRERVFSGINLAVNLNELPTTVVEAIDTVAREALRDLKKTPYVINLKKEDRPLLLDMITATLASTVEKFQTNEDHGLPLLRASVFKSLRRHENTPFYLGDSDYFHHTDYETAILTLLKEATVDTQRTQIERVAAAASLASYLGRLSAGDKIIKTAKKEVKDEREEARDNHTREIAAAVLSALG